MVRHGASRSSQPRVPEEARQGPAPRPPPRRTRAPAWPTPSSRSRGSTASPAGGRCAPSSTGAAPPRRPTTAVELFAAIRAGEEATVDRLLAAAPGARQRARRGGQHPADRRGRRVSRRAHPAPAPPRRRSAPGLRPLRPHAAVLGGGDRGLRLRPRAHAGRRRAGSLLRRRPGRGRPGPRVLRRPTGASGRAPPPPAARATPRTARACPARPAPTARWCPTRSTWRAAPATKARCASCSRAGPISPSRPSRGRPRCTGPTSRARPGGGAPARRGGGCHAPRSRARLHA